MSQHVPVGLTSVGQKLAAGRRGGFRGLRANQLLGLLLQGSHLDEDVSGGDAEFFLVTRTGIFNQPGRPGQVPLCFFRVGQLVVRQRTPEFGDGLHVPGQIRGGGFKNRQRIGIRFRPQQDRRGGKPHAPRLGCGLR